MATNLNKHREFEYCREDFERVVKIIYRVSGISLSERKEDMVYSRLARRLRKHGIQRFGEYLDFVVQDTDEQKAFVNALTTNLTHFFREEHHFDHLEDVFFPKLFSTNHRRIRIWSAGCSTGEEPYTLSMVRHNLKNKPKGIDFKILATDLDTNVLDTGRAGIYSDEKLAPISSEYTKWFSRDTQCRSNQKIVSDVLKKDVHFKQLNLMQDWPMKGPFQLIICRNVLIYFDRHTQEKLIARYSEMLEVGGYLILGHSESLGKHKLNYENLGKTIFRKIH